MGAIGPVIGCNEVTVAPMKNLFKTFLKVGPQMLLTEVRTDRSKFLGGDTFKVFFGKSKMADSQYGGH